MRNRVRQKWYRWWYGKGRAATLVALIAVASIILMYGKATEDGRIDSIERFFFYLVGLALFLFYRDWSR